MDPPRNENVELMNLPNELLDLVVQHRTLPEDLENLALTCKRLYAICLRRIPGHNALRKRFRKFEYSTFEPTSEEDYPAAIGSPIRSRYTAYSAFDMLSLIAVEPDVALYIKEADFSNDSRTYIPADLRQQFTPDENHENAVKRLLSSSPFFDEVHKWEDYYAEMQKEYEPTWTDYSAYAAAFLLSLLPNVEKLKVPLLWVSGRGGADRLLKRVVCKSIEPGSSLSEVTHLFLRDGQESSTHTEESDYPSSSECLFRLPQLRIFASERQRPWDTQQLKSALGSLPLDSSVLSIRLDSPRMNASELGIFLSSCPNLKALTLSHENPDRVIGQPEEWDICSVIREIGQKVGGHLEVLKLYHEQVFGIEQQQTRRGRPILEKDPLTPGQVSLLGFSKLSTLCLPLEVIENTFAYQSKPPIPPTVKVLALSSFGRASEAKALEMLYQFLKSDRRMLKQFVLLSNEHGSVNHKKRFNQVCDNLKRMGVNVYRETIQQEVFWLFDDY